MRLNKQMRWERKGNKTKYERKWEKNEATNISPYLS